MAGVNALSAKNYIIWPEFPNLASEFGKLCVHRQALRHVHLTNLNKTRQPARLKRHLCLRASPNAGTASCSGDPSHLSVSLCSYHTIEIELLWGASQIWVTVDVAQVLLPAASALMPTCSVGAENKGRDESRPGRLKPAPQHCSSELVTRFCEAQEPVKPITTATASPKLRNAPGWIAASPPVRRSSAGWPDRVPSAPW